MPSDKFRLEFPTVHEDAIMALMEEFPETVKVSIFDANDPDYTAFELYDRAQALKFLDWATPLCGGDLAAHMDGIVQAMRGRNPDGVELRDIEENPRDPNQMARHTAQKYNLEAGLPPLQETAYVKVDKEIAKEIAAAFEAMPNDPAADDVANAYEALVNEVEAQFKMLPVTVISTSEHGGYPYKTSQDLMDDIAKNNRMIVYDGGEDHAILSRYQNFMFRAVHDYFGHAANGFEFGPRGEENAWIEHSKMFTPVARQALTTETRGQNSWVNYGPNSHLPVDQRPYAAQKVGILPVWAQTHEVLEKAYEGYPNFYSGALINLAEKSGQLVSRNPESAMDMLFDLGEKIKVVKQRAPSDMRISPDVYDRVTIYFTEGRDGMHWYEQTPKRIKEFFNNDPQRTDLFIAFLAATSPLRNIKENTKLALKALQQYDQGARFPTDFEEVSKAEYAEARRRGEPTMVRQGKEGPKYGRIHCPPRAVKFDYKDRGTTKKQAIRNCSDFDCCFRLGMPNHEENAARVARGEPLSGPKVTAFYRNLTTPAAQDNGVTVDTWMLRAFGLRSMDDKDQYASNAPTAAEYAVVENAIRGLAEIEHVSPRQYQAAVWVGIKRLHGDVTRDTDEPFEVVLQREAEKAVQQDVFAFAEGDELNEISQRRDDRHVYGPLSEGLAEEIGVPDEIGSNPYADNLSQEEINSTEIEFGRSVKLKPGWKGMVFNDGMVAAWATSPSQDGGAPHHMDIFEVLVARDLRGKNRYDEKTREVASLTFNKKQHAWIHFSDFETEDGMTEEQAQCKARDLLKLFDGLRLDDYLTIAAWPYNDDFDGIVREFHAYCKNQGVEANG